MIIPPTLPGLVFAVANATQPFVSLSIPSSLPPTAQPLDPYLAGFSLEQESWPDWAGKLNEPNVYIQQLLTNLEERTGVPSAIRIGGSSLDCSWLDNNTQYVRSSFPPPRQNTPYPGANYVAVGRDFYALSANFAPGTRFTWGVPLKPFQLNETLAQASQIQEVFQGNRSSSLSGQHLEYLEIGNEANYWGFPNWWNPTNYTQTFNRYAKAISNVIQFSPGQTEFLAGSFTGTAGMYPWSALGVMGHGMFTDDDVGKYVGGWSQHKYNGQNDGQKDVKAGSLDNKSGIRGNLAQLFVDAQAVRSAGRKYVLGETNSYSNHGLPGTSNTAESVLFGVDHMLYGATMGISRMYFHNGVGYHYSSLVPSGSVDDGYNQTRPHIGALYHSYLIVNEAIGSTGQPQIAELATNNNFISAYGIWEWGYLARVLLVNNEPYTDKSVGARGNITVHLEHPGSKGGSIKWFETKYTNSTRGMKWGGQDFDTASGKPDGEVKETDWTNGEVNLPATSIALVKFW